MSNTSSAELDRAVAEYLRTCKKPVDFGKLVQAISEQTHCSEFEIKESVWRLLDQHEAELTDSRELVFAG